MEFRKLRPFLIRLGMMSFTTVSWACSAMLTPNPVLIGNADAIVRVEVLGYTTPPANTGFRDTGVPDSTVRFKVIEVLRGLDISDLVLPGYVVQKDDFNDLPSPYTFVRPGGRGGSYYANSYRDSAQYLLFLKRIGTGELSVKWAPLAPVNEQLHSSEDPWLIWVRQQVEQLQKTSQLESRAPLVSLLKPGFLAPTDPTVYRVASASRASQHPETTHIAQNSAPPAHNSK